MSDLLRLEAALLERGAVRKGRHLRVTCLFPDHADTRPSCDVDLDKGVFFCRSCHRGGGLRDLAGLLGLDQELATTRARDPRAGWRFTGPPPMLRRRNMDPDYGRMADWVRSTRALIADRRKAASAQGDTDATWRTLADLSELERRVETVESDLEAERRDARP